MSTMEILDRGRASFDWHVWGEAYAQLSGADRQVPLAPEDLERLAVAAHLVGEDEVSAEVWERANQRFLDQGEVARAVRCAFWLAFGLFKRGEMAPGGGWLARAQRLLDERQLDCVEQGYLLVPVALATLEDVQQQMGEDWESIAAYGFDGARTPSKKAAGRGLMKAFGVSAIPEPELAHIDVPTTLIWGRHDLQARLGVAEAASERYGWPLHVIEDCASDPNIEQPEAFVDALHAALHENTA